MEFNELEPIEQEDAPRSRFRNHRLRRGVYLLPTACTVANLMCGYYAVLATLEGRAQDFDKAAIAIGLAYVFDSLDGRIARAMNTESAFGREFDSLADIVSFGMAPAFLAYAWGVRTYAAANAPDYLRLSQLGWLVGFFFLGCCAWRLARFNIQGMAPGSNRYFVGMPTPAAAGLVAAVVHCFQNPIQDPRVSILWLILIVCLGLLMSSTVRHYSFKDIEWTRRRPSLAVIVMVLLLGAVVYFSRITLIVIAGAYSLHGVVLYLVRFARRRMASRTA